MAKVRAVHDLVERLLAPEGPLPALCEEQRRLARIVAEALDTPPTEEALVTLTQAATGTGKTIALLAPILALAALQKRQGVRSHRATLSTFTNHLARQILEDDAPRVNRALEALGFPALSVATRAGRRQFIDPDRVERAIARLPDRGRNPIGRVLADLGAFATFAEAEDHGVFLPPGISADALCVTARSRGAAAAAFAAAKGAAAAADVVLTNHALVLTDCRLGGRVLGAGGRPETVLFDEADALPEVARGVADDRIDLAHIGDIVDAAGEDAKEPCPSVPLPTLRLPPRGNRRTARGETWFGYSFVPGDLHPLPSASSPGAPDSGTSGEKGSPLSNGPDSGRCARGKRCGSRCDPVATANPPPRSSR